MSKFTTSIKLALRNLYGNKARTALSLLGIVIGVTSVILILSLGNGLRGFVVAQVESFGTDIVEIEVKVPQTSQISSQNVASMAGGMQITTLNMEDVEEVAKLPNLGDWYGGILGQQIASYEGENEQTFIFGVSAGMMAADSGAELEKGSFFLEEDDRDLKQVVVLGSKTKELFFPNEEAVGKSIKVGKKKFKVIGVMKERSSAGGFDFNKILYIPVRTLQKKIMGIDHIQFAIFKVNDMDKADQTMEEMRAIMRDRHDIEYDNEKDKKDGIEDDFAVISIAEAKEILDKVFNVINYLLLALASISLVVGGVGIMNVMYVAVTERTREIGLRKAVGARNRDILWQFIFESIFLTFIGGVVGVILGIILSGVATYAISAYDWGVVFDVSKRSVLLAVGFSMVTGLVFGFYPAKRASQLTPAEAIRKE
ncbi:MAG: ABC transporter permease [Candidatus Moranbacteria bacterium]|jgi:ABC-type antimicrobial peptide transport system permease subunit|nr:ABC transporter permease [Candidatus Moranbacteria bacterium]